MNNDDIINTNKNLSIANTLVLRFDFYKKISQVCGAKEWESMDQIKKEKSIKNKFKDAKMLDYTFNNTN
jgi:hypothetical protein